MLALGSLLHRQTSSFADDAKLGVQSLRVFNLFIDFDDGSPGSRLKFASTKVVHKTKKNASSAIANFKSRSLASLVEVELSTYISRIGDFSGEKVPLIACVI